MKSSILRSFFCLFSLLIPLAVPAYTIVECVDSDGSWSYRDKCPPEMTVRATKELRGEREEAGPSVEEIAGEHPVVLFTAPNCDACDLVRNQLQSRNVPYSEKDSSSDPDTQAELAALTGGPLTVPTVTVGAQKFTGYRKNDIDSALNQAGYP